MRFGELFLCRTVALPPLVGKGWKQKGRWRASTGPLQQRPRRQLPATAAASPQPCPVAPSATWLAAGSVTAARQSQPCGHHCFAPQGQPDSAPPAQGRAGGVRKVPSRIQHSLLEAHSLGFTQRSLSLSASPRLLRRHGRPQTV